MTNHDRLRRVFVESLALSPDFDADTIRLYETPGWDSMGHMTLVVAIEDEFDVELDPDQIIEMDSFEVAVRTLRELGVST